MTFINKLNLKFYFIMYYLRSNENDYKYVKLQNLNAIDLAPAALIEL
jgi:hypothetical protein